ncbi:hypothetical protein SAMN06265339_0478 [Desulfurobacterium pacificum]|jgi:uncharacterized C2H2 Zn-finger protein|uniref:Uncharacterized protein n=1 Tax=Desulfurobacterium pacificum TaxID=240166 RepID=A0ABY1NDY5_9BACT|nr:hypothetical protein [Desulfurobacterium pacificum]SMP07374.1 hypothetical protein SAMN06265339_0478 [Desulfurobacterium pacificum]
MESYKKLLKCSTCGNVGEFEYIGSRDVNKTGDVADIIGSKSMWISYFKCPNCGSIEVDFHPVGEEPDIPAEFFREVGSDGKENP